MSRHVTVRLTVAQAEALNSAAAEIQAGEGDHWTTAGWATLGRARDALLAAMEATTGGKQPGNASKGS